MLKFQTERLHIFAGGKSFPPLRNKGEIRKFLSDYLPLQTQEFNYLIGQDEPDGDIENDWYFFLFDRERDHEVGYLASRWDPERSAAVLGFLINPPYRRMGYATEAGLAISELLLAQPKVLAIISETFSDWRGSRRVMEKLGMTVVKANDLELSVRYARVKPGANIDLVEREMIALQPAIYPWWFSLETHFMWQWRTFLPENALLALSLMIMLLPSSDALMVGRVGCISYFAYIIARHGKWFFRPKANYLIQFRQAGFFYASRDGTGRLLPWQTFKTFRTRRLGGIELWNGTNWFWIPPSSFSGNALEKSIKFLELKQVLAG